MKYFNLLLILTVLFIFTSCKQSNQVKLIPVSNGKEYQYIDKEGKIVINPQFSVATVFRDGLALVETSGDERKWGYIDENGKFVIMANYLGATVFSEGIAWVVSENSAPKAIDKKGKVLITLEDAESVNVFKEGLASYSVVSDDGVRWGFIDKKGTVKINPQFNYVKNFSDGLCAVANKDGKWGYINKDGKMVVNYQFEGAENFTNGKAVIVSGGKFGLVNKEGKYLINPQFTQMLIDGDICMIRQDEKWGWCDKDGKILINPQFSDALPFRSNKLAPVKSGDSYGFIDRQGKFVINPQFDLAVSYNNDIAMVKSNDKIGFVDKNGKYVINTQFEDISDDFVTYVVYNGRSYFEEVESQYFNISGILKKLNLDAPEGLTLNSKLSEVCKKFNKTQYDFSQYQNQYNIISDNPISNDVSYGFNIVTEAYNNVQVGFYMQSVFNPEAKIDGLIYYINFHGKGYGKQKDVRDAIEKSLSGYTKDSNLSSPLVSVFSNKNQTIRVFYKNGMVFVYVSRLGDYVNVDADYLGINGYGSNNDSEYEETATEVSTEIDTSAAGAAPAAAPAAAAAQYNPVAK